MLVVLAGFAAVIGVATPAGADPGSNGSVPDTSFLAALDTAGITYQSKTAAVAVGKEACALMDPNLMSSKKFRRATRTSHRRPPPISL
jgi:hypothetical protein